MSARIAPSPPPFATTGADADQLAATFKALADPVRLRLLALIAGRGEACVCDLNEAFDLSQPTISHHLRVLADAGLVDREKRGVWAYYRLGTASLSRARAALGG